MKQQTITVLLALLFTASMMSGCDDFLGSKQDDITNEIFDQGKQDPNLIVDEVGYVALLPFWDGFESPTDVFVGYDELVYVTDANGLHVLDRAGRKYNEIPLRGAVSVTQDRLLNVYVAARYDTVITSLPEPHNQNTWDLPAVYKIKNANGAGDTEILQIMVHPFMDASRATTNARTRRLNRDLADNEELVEITGVTALANNDIYISRRGPANETGQAIAQDNTVLLMVDERDEAGNRTGRMRNTSQLRALNPNVPSVLSAIELNDIISFAAPPQRDNITQDRSFMVAQGGVDREISFRVLWINAVNTPDGLVYQPNSSLLVQDTSRADSFLYEQDKFVNPSGLAYSADERSHIFVVDSGTHMLHLFQSNGIEGINPPAGSNVEKAINVSFGGLGSGPRELDSPSGVAYFRRIVFVADTGNNRIARYRLNTDFE